MAFPTQRSYASRFFALTLDGYDAPGFLKSVEGGGIKGELITQQLGGQPWRVKHINNPTIDPITVSVPLSMSSSFMEWVKKSWAGEVERRSGAIVTYDHDMNPVHEYQFTEALILETVVPTLDGNAGKEPGYITVKFQPETAKHVKQPSGSKIPVKAPGKQTQWSPANWKFEIDGLITQSARVAKIDGFTVKQNVKPMWTGPDWMYQLEPTSLEFPNIVFYTSGVDAGPLIDWHDSFVLQGKNNPADEKNGAITLLNNALNEELLTIELFSLGVHNLTAEKMDASGADLIGRYKVELYCEEMKWTYPGG